MTYTVTGRRVPWEWMPQAMASGVEHGSKRWRVGNLYRVRIAWVRWLLYGVGWCIGRVFRPAWTLALLALLTIPTAARADYWTLDLALSETEYDGALLSPVSRAEGKRHFPVLVRAHDDEKYGVEVGLTWHLDPRYHSPVDAVWAHVEDEGFIRRAKVGVTLKFGGALD